MKRQVFVRLSHLAPAMVLYAAAPIVLVEYASAVSLMRLVSLVYMIMVGLLVVDGFLNAAVDICQGYEFAKRLPIRGFVQVIRIVLYFAVAVGVVSLIVGKNPSALLAGMGAMTAVLLLVFKDSILGFVAGIQLSANQMVHIGDWIEMPQYGADGDVIDISLTTVKVRNWDKTISTIPAYALISDSFKNWRGMSESGGRRIKRSVCIDMNTIRFCDDAMLERFKHFQYISDYIEQKKTELVAWNNEKNIDASEPINGRRLTNIGTFRAYLVSYLRDHPKIHHDMTFLVRHLEPTGKGLPIQIYVFSKDQAWAGYEAIQADIFDHILAVIPQFGLAVFQEPTGNDFHQAMRK
jgi:miniconductance mechanosensitive channel